MIGVIFMQENQKICRIVEEFSLYLLEHDIDVLNITIKKSANRVALNFICDIIEKELLDELVQVFKYKRQEAIEMYGWELIGQGDLDNELQLVSTLINYFTYYIYNDKVCFNLVRYE